MFPAHIVSYCLKIIFGCVCVLEDLYSKKYKVYHRLSFRTVKQKSTEDLISSMKKHLVTHSRWSMCLVGSPSYFTSCNVMMVTTGELKESKRKHQTKHII